MSGPRRTGTCRAVERRAVRVFEFDRPAQTHEYWVVEGMRWDGLGRRGPCDTQLRLEVRLEVDLGRGDIARNFTAGNRQPAKSTAKISGLDPLRRFHVRKTLERRPNSGS